MQNIYEFAVANGYTKSENDFYRETFQVSEKIKLLEEHLQKLERNSLKAVNGKSENVITLTNKDVVNALTEDSLKTFLKEDSTIITEDGRTLRDFLKDIKKFLEQTPKGLTAKSAALLSVEDVKELLKSDMFLITKTGETQRSFNNSLLEKIEENKLIASEYVLKGSAGVTPFQTEVELKKYNPTASDPQFAYAYDTSITYFWEKSSWTSLGTSDYQKAVQYIKNIFENVIPENSNLNEYQKTGQFFRLLNSDVFNTTSNNYPSTYAGVLEVKQYSRFIYQTYTTYSTRNFIYFRAAWRDANSNPEDLRWSSWKKVVTTEDLEQLESNFSNTVQSALSALFSNVINEGVSLNTYQSSGYFFRLLNSSISNTPANNYPSTQAGVLEVKATSRFVYHTYHTYLPSNTVYFRAAWRSSSTSAENLEWSSWKKVTTEDELLLLKEELVDYIQQEIKTEQDKKFFDDSGNSFDVAFMNSSNSTPVTAFSSEVAYLLDSYLRKQTVTQLSDSVGNSALAVEKDGTVVIQKLKTPLYNVLKTQLGQIFKADFLCVNSDGQSLNMGTSSVETINTSQPFSNVMLSGGVWSRPSNKGFLYSLSPLTSNVLPDTTSRKETSLVSFVNKLSEYDLENGIQPSSKKYLAINSGVGGTEIELFEKGTEYYQSRLSTIRAAWQTCKDQGKTFQVLATNWVQGETNHNTAFRNSMKDYLDRMVGLHDDLYNDILDFIPDQPRPYNLVYQVNALRYYKTNFMDIGIAHWMATRKYPQFILTTPCYALPLSEDKLHLTSEGYYLFGLYQARALSYTIYGDGDKFRPVEPVEVEWTDTHIDIKYHVRAGLKLVLSEELCPMSENFGFDLWVDSKTDTPLNVIKEVTVLSKDTVRVTLKEPCPTALLTYARGRSNSSVITHTGARGNLHDNWGDYEQVELPLSKKVHKMHNASVMYRYSNLKGFF